MMLTKGISEQKAVEKVRQVGGSECINESEKSKTRIDAKIRNRDTGEREKRKMKLLVIKP